MKKILITLIFYFFSIIHAFAISNIIYCYQVKNNKDEKKFTDLNVNLSNSERVNIYEIDDKKKTISILKSYTYGDYPLLPKTKGYFGNSFVYKDIEDTKLGLQKQNKKKDQKNTKSNWTNLIFDKNQIIKVLNYKNKKNESKRSYIEFDRVSGILIRTYGISINEKGEEFVENDGSFYFRDDFYFKYHVYSEKYICENNKNL